MSYFDRIWNGLKAVMQIEGDVARLTAKVEQLDARERETRERLIYLEGLIAGRLSSLMPASGKPANA